MNSAKRTKNSNDKENEDIVRTSNAKHEEVGEKNGDAQTTTIRSDD